MYREQDVGAVLVKVDAQKRELADVRAELDVTQRELWKLRLSSRSRSRRLLNLGSLIGCVGALAGGVVDAITTGSIFSIIGLVVGCGFGTMLALQGQIDARPQDAPPERLTGGGGG